MNKKQYWAGLDVGSTTIKIVVVNPDNKEILYHKYIRHNADQAGAAYGLLENMHREFSGRDIALAVCGSGGQTIAQQIDAFFIQEVVANSIAIRAFHEDVRVAIELGGQDAKVVFFHYDEKTRQLVASDMRMNGSCAGGTGAFIDQVAELLHVDADEFSELANKGQTVYDISGRCGVFAKTDIQPLMNQGVHREDIALSTFHAIAKQTIGGLAQGMDISPGVIFEGGPLTFNPRLIEVFKERLMLGDGDVVIPDKPQLLVAQGAALSVEAMFSDRESLYHPVRSLQKLKAYMENRMKGDSTERVDFFNGPGEREEFDEKHPLPVFASPEWTPGLTVTAFLGIDAGSTTSKFILLDENEEVIDCFYSNNRGDPLKVIKYALINLRDKYKKMGVDLQIKGVGTTGYGEVLFARAFKADYHTVETVAHAKAAQKYAPGVTFILDIGGQDMKAINLKAGIVTGIVLNEACSAGCGSFIETYARSLGIPVEEVAEYAFRADNPSRLGSRCTVFMNSSIITEQKNGRTTEDILAGISRSIIENVFTKVVRISNLDILGDTIVVQGGTFKNNAVLRAFEQYTGRDVIRPPFPGEMGAIGIAVLTKKHIEEKERQEGMFRSSFIGLNGMDAFEYHKQPGLICQFCQNNCNRTVVTFNDGTKYITGNRCERGEILGDPSSPGVKKQLKDANQKMSEVPDMMKYQNTLLFKDYGPEKVDEKKNITIGIPRTLEFWVSMPFWHTLFKSLGFDVVISRSSNYDIFEQGLHAIPSDTVCFPAKLVHGHVLSLVKKGVDRIFMPMMIRMPKENRKATNSHVCAVVQGYPLVVARSDEPEEKYNVPFDFPTFHWYNDKLKIKQTVEYFHSTFGISKQIIRKGIQEAEKALVAYNMEMKRAGRKILESLEGSNRFAILLAGRPYHSDELVNHNISKHFTRLGIPVMNLDSLPELHDMDLEQVRMETTIPFHTRMMSASIAACSHPNLEIVQIVSFGCGHDAIISDEMIRILRRGSDKELLILKLDEGEAVGPLNIRIKSFIETIRIKRKTSRSPGNKEVAPESAFKIKFTRKDKPVRTILAPNLSPAFSYLISNLFRRDGYKMKVLPLADDRAIELGKKYVHNDICYPAQVNIGEALAMLESGEFKSEEVAVGLAKNCEDCRAGQYATLARKALDEAGYTGVPIITTGVDTKDMHPGFRLSMRVQIGMLWGLAMIDGLEMMLRKIRPYELNKGETELVFNKYMTGVSDTLAHHRKEAVSLFKEAVSAFNAIPIDREVRKPRVCIIGEVLLNYHPVSNGYVEQYLEANGMETILPSMVDFFRKGLIHEKMKSSKGMTPSPFLDYMVNSLTDRIYDFVLDRINRELQHFKFADPFSDIHDLIKHIEDIVDLSFIAGEGWLLPAEIIHKIHEGVNSFVIVQPFGCLPNHITGRGLMKTIKKHYPHVQIISLDYDPDTSFGNVENRLQMLIITARELEKSGAV